MRTRVLTSVVAAGIVIGCVSTTARATSYDNPCARNEPEKASSTQTYGIPPSSGGTEGKVGVKGSNGYLEGRDDGSQSGAVHGATAGKDGYGYVGADEGGGSTAGLRVCVGSGDTKQELTL